MEKILQEISLEKDDKKNYKKTWIILISLALVIASIFISNLYYIDIPNGCFITVEEDVAGGSKNGIYKSLEYIKKNNPSDYKKVCSNVTNIIEKYCLYMDPRVRTGEEFKRQGCYIKGSKIIYILPSTSTDESEIISKSKNIIKYANYSYEYWRNK